MLHRPHGSFLPRFKVWSFCGTFTNVLVLPRASNSINDIAMVSTYRWFTCFKEIQLFCWKIFKDANLNSSMRIYFLQVGRAIGVVNALVITSRGTNNIPYTTNRLQWRYHFLFNHIVIITNANSVKDVHYYFWFSLMLRAC